jgi:hypothetical protein
MYKVLAFPITPQQQQAFLAFIAKKEAFDRISLKNAEQRQEIKMVEGKLLNATFLKEHLESRPEKMSFSLARAMAGYLLDAGTSYQSMRELMVAAGEDTRELDLEIAKSEILREVIDEVMAKV